MKRKFLSMLLALAMVVGMLPVSFLAGLVPQADAASGDDYTVSFVKDAYNIASVGVNIVDGSSPPVRIKDNITSDVTLDGAAFTIEDRSIQIANIVAGYGLMYVETSRQGGQDYLFQEATWGQDGSRITELTYESIQQNAGEAIYLHYRADTNTQYDIHAVVKNGSGETVINTYQTSNSGAITEAQADQLVANETQDYFFNNAELRPKNGSAADAIPIDSVRLMNGKYYVRSSLSLHSNVEETFDASKWDVYFVYEPAVTLTLTLEKVDNAGNLNQIDGQPITSLGDILTYQVPTNGSREIVFTVGTGGNLDLTDTTNGGSDVLFSNARDGYQVKTYTLTLQGNQGDKTMTARFSGTSGAKYLDYSHRFTNPDNYHGFNLFYSANGGSDDGTQLTDANGRKIQIQNNGRLRIKFGVASDNLTYVPNAIILNGTFLNMPWPGVNYVLNGSQGTVYMSRTTDILDSAGNRMATVTMTGAIQRESDNTIAAGSYLDLKFTNLQNNVKIDFINLIGEHSGSAGELRLVNIGEGVTMYQSNQGNLNNWSEFLLGRGIGRNANRVYYAQVQWDYYIDQFTLRSPGSYADSQAGNWTEQPIKPGNITGGPNGGTAKTDEWWGDKAYCFSYTGGNTQNPNNDDLLAGMQQGVLNTQAVTFSFRYDVDGQTGGDYLLDGKSFTYTMLNPTGTPTVSANVQPVTPSGKVFAGWSLYPEGNNGGRGLLFEGGAQVSRGVIDSDTSVINYDPDNVGKAWITLYPVFEDLSASGDYTSYTVYIHNSPSDPGTPLVFTGLNGSVLDRDAILSMPEVETIITGLGNTYVLDGGLSDSAVDLTAGQSNVFHLYFNDTNNVDIIFRSEHGFDGETGTEKQTSQKPGSAMTVPTPKTQDVGATFIGWSTLSPDDMIGAQSLDKTTVPYQDTTYYAVYAENVTVTFYPFDGDTGTWDTASKLSFTIPYNTSLDGNKLTQVANKAPQISGYTWMGWYQDGPYGTKVDNLGTVKFTANTNFYARYEAASTNTVVLHGNGGSWDTAGDKTLNNLTFGSVLTADTNQEIAGPTTPKAGGYVFVGWSTDQDAPFGSPTITVGAGQTEYYAIWMQTALTVQASGELVYDGTAKTPALTVTWNGTTINAGNGTNGYTLSYSTADQQAPVNAGTYSVTVTYQGKTGFATFTVKPKEISSAQGVTISGVQDPVTYDGQPFRPDPTVTDTRIGNKVLVAGTDYRLAYGDNTNVGSGTVTVIGMGNYTGQQEVTFRINPVTTTTGGQSAIAVRPNPMPDYIYNGGQQPANFDYVVYDTVNDLVMTADKDYTVSGLPAADQWTLGEHTFTVNGTGNYQGATVQVTFKIVAKGQRLNVTVNPDSIQGSSGKPQITVQLDGVSGNLGAGDYTLKYEKFDEATRTWTAATAEMTDPGMYRITATGSTGTDYDGAVGTANFVRIPAETGQLSVTLGGGQTVIPYDGANHWDTVKTALKVATEDGTEVNTFTYTVGVAGGSTVNGTSDSHANFTRKDVATYVITVSAEVDSVTTTGTLYVYVTARDLADTDITIVPDSNAFPDGRFEVVYDGKVHDHPYTITDAGLTGGTVTLQADQDYVEAAHDHDTHTGAGTYVVTVNGTGNYTGSKTFTFNILPKTITISDNVELEYRYSSNDITTALADILTKAQNELVAGDADKVDIHLSVDPGLGVGTHKHLHGNLIGTAAGNYKLEITGQVVVKAVDLTDVNDIKMEVKPEVHGYNGSPHEPAVIVTTTKDNLTLQEGTHYSLTYYFMGADDPGADAEPTSGTKVTEMKDPGYYIIRATAIANGGYTGHVDGKFRITPADFDEIFVTVTGGDRVFTGADITLNKSDLKLVTGGGTDVADFEIASYNNNRNVGTATVNVKANGSIYSGTFEIIPKDISETADTGKEISVGNIPDQDFDGAAKTPVPTITCTPANGTQVTLVNGRDFSLTYAANNAIGQATVTIKGEGNYTGERQVKFNIVAVPVKISFYTWTETGGWALSQTTLEATFGAALGSKGDIEGLAAAQTGFEFAGWAENSPVATPLLTSETLSQRDDFNAAASFYAVYTAEDDIQITLDANSGKVDNEATKTYTVTYGQRFTKTPVRDGYTFAGWSKTQGAAVGELTITVPADGGTWYAVWLQPKLDVDVTYDTAATGAFIYNGQAQRPTVKVTGSDGAEVEIPADDVNWGTTGIDAGLHSFTVNYNGSTGFGTYLINRKDISGNDTAATVSGTFTYDGRHKYPAPTVSVNGTQLLLNQDFTVAYTDNLNAGTGKITVTGIGNYTGSKANVTFTISPYTGKLTVAPIPDQEYTGAEITISNLVVYDSHGNVLAADDMNVVYSGNKDLGTATVNVSGKADGNYTGASGTGSFQIVPVGGGSGAGSGLTVTVTPATSTVGGADPQISVVQGASNNLTGADYDLTYEAYENGAWVDKGALNNPDTDLDAVGMYRVTATGKGGYNGLSGSAVFVRTAADPTEGEEGDISYSGFNVGGADGLVYDGTDHLNAVLGGLTVTSSGGTGSTLTYGQDYKVTVNGSELTLNAGTYSGADMTNAGAYTVVIQGMNGYASSNVSTTVYIQPQDIGNATLAGLDGHTYGDDSFATPTVTVTDADLRGGNTTLTDTRDYTVTGLDAITATADAGTYLVTVTGTGNFTGAKTVAYRVAPKTVTIAKDVTLSYGYTTVDLSALEAEVTGQLENGDTAAVNLYVTPGLAVNATGHDNQVKGYLTGADAGNYVLAITSKVIVNAATIDPDDGTGGGTGGDPNNVFAVYVSPDTGIFNGSAHNPDIYVTHNGQLLEQGTDYRITGYATEDGTDVSDMTNVGKYTIKLEGTGSYTGSFTGGYEILNGSAGGNTGGVLTIDKIPDQTYTGTAIDLDAAQLVVRYNGVELTRDQDYTVEYGGSNVHAGTATVTVTGKGQNYDGMTGTATFTILRKSIGTGAAAPATGIEVTGVQTDYPYDGKPVQPVVTVKDTVRNETLKLNTDYAVTYGPNVSGQGAVTVTGIGNYTGSVVLTFTITASDRLTISGLPSTVTYNGAQQQPEFTVKDGNGNTLVKDQDYTVSYTDNLNVGTATVTVTGLGEYTGLTATGTFRIEAKLLNLDVTADPASGVVGDGQTPAVTVKLDNQELADTAYTLSYQKYDADGNLVPAQESDLADAGMYVIIATGTGEHAGALGSTTFVRLASGSGTLDPVIPNPDPDNDPNDEGVSVDATTGVITMTYNGKDRVSVLDGIKITTDGTTEATITSTKVSYNSGAQEDLAGYQMINAGVYTVTYTATEGTAVVTVIINPKNINDGTISVTGLGEKEYTYDATQQSPNVSLTDSETNSITATTDYTVAQVSQTNAGSYQVAITGTGNYTGVRYGTFIINQAELTVTGIGVKPAFVYGYTSRDLTKDTEFTVNGIQTGDENDVTVTVTVPAGLGAGEHTITPVIGGTDANNYTLSDTSGVAITVNPYDPTDPDGTGNPDKDPDGDGVNEDEDGNGVVDPDKDGDGDGFIEDEDDGTGSSTGDGVIETVGGLKVVLNPISGAFNGKAHTPTVTVTYTPDGGQETELALGQDYTVTYLSRTADGKDGAQVAEMIQEGAYTVRVTLTGNYKGGFDLTYTITPATGGATDPDNPDKDTDGDGSVEDGNNDGAIEYNGYTVNMVPTEVYHNGQAQYPKVTVTFNDGTDTTALLEGRDFAVSYLDSKDSPVTEMVDVGSYTVRVKLQGNYTGDFDLTYTIRSTPTGGGGGGTGGDDKPNIPGLADPDDTGVSDWLVTEEHIAYLQGDGNGQFRPDGQLTRAEAAQMFYNLLRDKNVVITTSFTDVPDNRWFSKAVNTLASLGVLKGVGGNRFDPDAPITRAEFTAIAMRFTSAKVETATNPYTDVSPSNWYYEAVVGANAYGWIRGYGNGQFRPNNTITRAEVTAIVNRMLGRVPDESFIDQNAERLPVQFTDNPATGSWAYYNIVEATNGHDFTHVNGEEVWTGGLTG